MLLCDTWILIKSAVATFGLTLEWVNWVSRQPRCKVINFSYTCDLLYTQQSSQPAKQPALSTELEASLPTSQSLFIFLLTRTRQTRFQFHFIFIIFFQTLLLFILTIFFLNLSFYCKFSLSILSQQHIYFMKTF